VLRSKALLITSVVLATLTAPASRHPQNPPVSVQRAQEVLSYPKCVQCPEPRLTREAKARHVHGIVALEATITERGTVVQIAVMKGLDHGLTQQAIQTVRRWRMSPAIGMDGKPRALRIGILVTFDLGNAGGGFGTG
jgi:TonB family protein